MRSVPPRNGLDKASARNPPRPYPRAENGDSRRTISPAPWLTRVARLRRQARTLDALERIAAAAERIADQGAAR